MNSFILFTCELALIIIFNFCLFFSHSIIRHIERRRLAMSQTSEYLLYSKDRCSCLFMVCFSEIILLCICLTAVDAKVKTKCHEPAFGSDCATHRIIWKALLASSCIILCVILVGLLAFIPRMRQAVTTLRRQFHFQSWSFGFAHVLLQVSALFVVLSLSSDIILQDGPDRVVDDESIAIALIGVFTFEMGFLIWVFGTIIFVLELFVRSHRQLMESQGIAPRPAVLRRMIYIAIPMTDG
jgi:hypothetical protein